MNDQQQLNKNLECLIVELKRQNDLKELETKNSFFNVITNKCKSLYNTITNKCKSYYTTIKEKIKYYFNKYSKNKVIRTIVFYTCYISSLLLIFKLFGVSSILLFIPLVLLVILSLYVMSVHII